MNLTEKDFGLVVEIMIEKLMSGVEPLVARGVREKTWAGARQGVSLWPAAGRLEESSQRDAGWAISIDAGIQS